MFNFTFNNSAIFCKCLRKKKKNNKFLPYIYYLERVRESENFPYNFKLANVGNVHIYFDV